MAVSLPITLSLLIPDIKSKQDNEKFFSNFTVEIQSVSDQEKDLREIIDAKVNERVFAVLNAITQVQAIKNKVQTQLAPADNYSITPLDPSVENKLSKCTYLKIFLSSVNNGSCEKVATDLIKREGDSFKENCMMVAAFAMSIFHLMRKSSSVEEELDIDSFAIITDTTIIEGPTTFEEHYSSLEKRISNGSVYYSEYKDIIRRLFDNITILRNQDSKKLCFHKKGGIDLEESHDLVRGGKSKLNSAKKYLGGAYLGLTSSMSYRVENLVKFARFFQAFIEKTHLSSKSQKEYENAVAHARAGLTKLNQKVYNTKEKKQKIISETIDILGEVQDSIKSKKIHPIDDQIAIFLNDSKILQNKEKIKFIAFRFESYLADFCTLQGNVYPILEMILRTKKFEHSLFFACLLVEKSLKTGKEIEGYCKDKLMHVNPQSLSEDLLRAKLTNDLSVFEQIRSEKIVDEKAVEEINAKRKDLFKTRRADLCKAGIKLVGGSVMTYFAHQYVGLMGFVPTTATYAVQGAQKVRQFFSKAKISRIWATPKEKKDAAQYIKDTKEAVNQESSMKVTFAEGLSEIGSSVMEYFISNSPASSPNISRTGKTKDKTPEKKVDQIESTNQTSKKGKEKEKEQEEEGSSD